MTTEPDVVERFTAELAEKAGWQAKGVYRDDLTELVRLATIGRRVEQLEVLGGDDPSTRRAVRVGPNTVVTDAARLLDCLHRGAERVASRATLGVSDQREEHP